MAEVLESLTEGNLNLGLHALEEWVHEKQPRICRVQVEIHPTSIHFITPDGSHHIFPLTEIQLLPKTCNGLQWVQDEGVHMRLQLAGTGDDGDRREVDEAFEKEEVEFLRSSACIVMCGMCKKKIVDHPCIFDRVLPLPSENWREVSESWCCHGNEGTRKFANHSLQPSKADCLVGNLYLLMHPSMLCREALQFCVRNDKQRRGCAGQNDKSQTVSLLCRRCRSCLGEASLTVADICKEDWSTVNSVKLFKHSIRIQSNGDDVTQNNLFSSYNTESYFAKYLASVSQMDTTFKFILENETSKQPYLLLWLLSPDTLLLTSDTSLTGRTQSCFYGDQESRETSRVMPGSKDECYCTVENNVKTHSVEARRIVKVLYQTMWDEEGKRVQQQWSKDLSVQLIPMPKATCLELMLLLAASNQHTPASMRVMNGFKVGYFRL